MNTIAIITFFLYSAATITLRQSGKARGYEQTDCAWNKTFYDPISYITTTGHGSQKNLYKTHFSNLTGSTLKVVAFYTVNNVRKRWNSGNGLKPGNLGIESPQNIICSGRPSDFVFYYMKQDLYEQLKCKWPAE